MFIDVYFLIQQVNFLFHHVSFIHMYNLVICGPSFLYQSALLLPVQKYRNHTTLIALNHSETLSASDINFFFTFSPLQILRLLSGWLSQAAATVVKVTLCLSSIKLQEK